LDGEMRNQKWSRAAFAWLELLLAIAILALLIQLLPTLWPIARRILDVRHWSRRGWIVANIIVVLALVGVRFGPELRSGFREAHKRIAAQAGRWRRRGATAGTHQSDQDADYEARARRDAEWRKRAKKRLPWQ
jgi:hypothetical protein